MPLTLLPGLGIALLGAAASEADLIGRDSPAAVVAVLALVAGIVLYLAHAGTSTAFVG